MPVFILQFKLSKSLLTQSESLRAHDDIPASHNVFPYILSHIHLFSSSLHLLQQYCFLVVLWINWLFSFPNACILSCLSGILYPRYQHNLCSRLQSLLTWCLLRAIFSGCLPSSLKSHLDVLHLIWALPASLLIPNFDFVFLSAYYYLAYCII